MLQEKIKLYNFLNELRSYYPELKVTCHTLNYNESIILIVIDELEKNDIFLTYNIKDLTFKFRIYLERDVLELNFSKDESLIDLITNNYHDILTVW